MDNNNAVFHFEIPHPSLPQLIHLVGCLWLSFLSHSLFSSCIAAAHAQLLPTFDCMADKCKGLFFAEHRIPSGLYFAFIFFVISVAAAWDSHSGSILLMHSAFYFALTVQFALFASAAHVHVHVCVRLYWFDGLKSSNHPHSIQIHWFAGASHSVFCIFTFLLFLLLLFFSRTKYTCKDLCHFLMRVLLSFFVSV